MVISAKNLFPRQILPALEKELKRDNILVIVGSRQVGKTSLLALLYKKLGKKQKVYFDLEDIQLLSQFNNLEFSDFLAYLQEKKGISPNKKTFVFIDEIQYLEHPSSFLKYIFDHYKQIKLIVSGSSSLEIKKKFSDRLTGRKSLYVLYPLDFKEFLIFKNKTFQLRKKINFKKLLKSQTITMAHQKSLNWSKAELEKIFEEFALLGGYPKTVLANDHEEKISILKEIQATYVRKDIKDLAEIENIKVYNNLIEILAAQSSNLLNIDELSNTLRANRKTIERYLFLLENTFITNLVKPFFTNKRKEITKMPKIFFKDVGLRNMLISNFNALEKRPDKGALIENLIYTELKKNLAPLEELYFWRTQTKTEVDFVIKGEKQSLLPIEVKYKKFKSIQIPRGLRSFILTYQPEKAFVITKDFLKQTRLKQTTIFFLPGFLI